MNDMTSTEEVLQELRKLVRSNYVAAFVSSLLLICVIWFFPTRRTVTQQPQQSQGDSWSSVRAMEDHTEFDKAFAMAQRLTTKYPSDPFGYSHLGNISLATGHLKEAESYYARAYAMFPTDDYEKALRAVRKRLQAETPQPASTP
jgi:cytochrome c-type biogenesis protein CcmH/NrfG